MLDPISEIKSRLSIEDVVAPYVQLKKIGRNFKACCPFHQEKTPSFIVSPEKGLAYCFGCHKGGDMFKFIEYVEGVDFKGALEILADKANVDLSAYKTSGPKITKDEKDVLFELQGETAGFYSRNLLDTEAGNRVLDYVRKRGLADESVREFKLGFAPDSYDSVYTYLVNNGFKKGDAVKCGVLISKDTAGEKVYDRFRLRLMFPICDDVGRVVAFGGRALKKGDEPKYLNSPESPVYHKGRVLYGLHLAKSHIKEQDLCVVVEGYMDLISSYQAGVKNVVASSGTALTVEQLKIIKRFTSNLAFSFDMDSAGREALFRAVQNAQPSGFNMKVVTIEGFKDPDECVKNNPENWRKAVAEAKYYLDFYLDDFSKKYDLADLEQSKEFCDLYLNVLKGVSHPLERDTYLKKLGVKLALPYAQLEERMKFLSKTALKPSMSKVDSEPKKTSISLQEYFVGFLINFKDRFAKYLDEKYADLFEDNLKNIYKRLASYYNAKACLDDGVMSDFTDEEKEKLQVYALYVDNRVSDWDHPEIDKEFEKVFIKVKTDSTKRKQKDLTKKIREARLSGDFETEAKLLKEYATFIS